MNTYFILPNSFFSAELNIYEKVVLALLTSYQNKEHKCFPSRKTMLKSCGISLTTLKVTMRGLVEKGFVSKSENFRKNGGQTSNVYTLNVPEDTKYFIVRKDIFSLNLSCKAIAVYLAVAFFARSGECSPSKKLIAQTAGISISTVTKALSELKDENIITSKLQTGDKGETLANVYILANEEQTTDTPMFSTPSPHVLCDPQEVLLFLSNTSNELIQEIDINIMSMINTS